MIVYVSKLDKEKLDKEKLDKGELNKKELNKEKEVSVLSALDSQKSQDQKEAKIFEVEEGYLTPVGVISAPVGNILDFMCDLGYEKIYLFVKDETYSRLGDLSLENKGKFEWETLNSIVSKLKSSEVSKECGAIVVFVGFVRGVTYYKGKVCKVRALKFEVYENLYSKKLEEICKKVEDEHNVKVKMFHKIGTLKPGENIVYVAVMGRHRRDVWKAAIDAVELMKKDLPVWKKEIFEVDGKIEEKWI